MYGVTDAQRAVCERVGAQPFPAPDHFIVGVGRGAGGRDRPTHGLRHPPEGDTTGWYIWTGEYSAAADFFERFHVEHLSEICPEAVPYLALPPGWRFLVAPGYEDVWWDEGLLDV